MRKVKIIAIILVIILAMGICVLIKYNQTEEVNELEIYQLQQYIDKLYGWQEIYTNALPKFKDINEADELWLWDRVKMQLIDETEEYEFSYEEINQKAKELYGEDLKKQFPKEGRDFWVYDAETSKYIATGIGLDDYEDRFVIHSVVKKGNQYNVEILEYLIDNTNCHQEVEQEQYEVYLLNLEGEKINTYNNDTDEHKIQNFVKENKNKFSQKTLVIQKQDNELKIKSVDD